jgi:hypothetical protein
MMWILEPVARADDGVWQGRPLMIVAVRAPNAVFARLAADRWAAECGYCDAQAPGFESQLLYLAREVFLDRTLANGEVALIEGPTPSIGPQNERPHSNRPRRESAEGKTTTTGGSDVPDFPGNSEGRIANGSA